MSFKTKVAVRSEIHIKRINARGVLRRISRRVRKIAKTAVSFVVSVRLAAWNNSVPTGRILVKSDI